MAVYDPGRNEVTMADSASRVGATPVLRISVCWLERQLSFEASNVPLASRSSSVGSAIAPGTGSDGPMARTITSAADVPTTIRPPIKTLSTVWTNARVEIFASFESTAVHQPDTSTRAWHVD